ncbi:acylneuraminate cytidylyltransferase family protein [Meridianimaribacter sp. CL38]|uniref:acylneuraminate cytidylyltransferase family protein n=1 Tax=Meridianimaribacter sp. CL38 TaxID=2213021 RepID=UPI00103D1CA0|nr:acylneuraminate cytidylyltransferase family protein [Meridianimaribacter sp. CL38]TBV25507.1 acylneuraminate cytidylyltransferase family protein [Meridianimaribacter sp. CL38]
MTLKSKKIIVIIPARRDSKRLPKKNVSVLGDVPLVAHSIAYAQSHPDLADAVYVTTNDSEVKAIAVAHAAQVVDRPEELCGDTATTVSALKHVLETIDCACEYVVLLQPTNPLRPKALLADALDVFFERGCDSLMTVSRTHQKLGKIVNERFEPFNYTMGQRSQDLEPLYYENGLLYICKASLILNDTILGTHNLPYIVNHPYATVDIDTEEDFRYAEYVLKNSKKK